MITFSLMQRTDSDVTVDALIWTMLQKKGNYILSRLRAGNGVKGYNDNDVQDIQSDLYQRFCSTYKESATDMSLPVEKRVEKFVNHSLNQFLKGYDREEQPVDYDRLFSADDEDLAIGDTIIRNKFVEVSKEMTKKQTVSLEQKLAKERLKRLLMEIMLQYEDLFNTFYCLLLSVNMSKRKNSLLVGNKKDKLLNNELMHKIFIMLINSEVSVDDIIDMCKDLKAYNKTTKLTTGVKTITMRSCVRSDVVLSDFYEGIILIPNKKIESKFNGQTLAFDRNIDLTLSKWQLVNPRTKAKTPTIFRLRIEQFLDYVATFSMPDEEVDTPFIKWLYDMYVMILPSGKRTEINISNDIYMRQVKEELLLNLLLNEIRGIFAIDEQYVYFTPNKRPSYNKVELKLYNDKSIYLGVEECCN